tara:strand:+ start:2717 stop:2968 length:252 start_codon:yes stop_codon:yes gene_type:complete
MTNESSESAEDKRYRDDRFPGHWTYSTNLPFHLQPRYNVGCDSEAEVARAERLKPVHVRANIFVRERPQPKPDTRHLTLRTWQ